MFLNPPVQKNIYINTYKYLIKYVLREGSEKINI